MQPLTKNKILTGNAFIATTALIAVTLFLVGCFKKEVCSKIPLIEFASLSKNTMRQDSRDTFIIRIKFKDGDGDLGDNDTSRTAKNVFIVDSRDGFLQPYHLTPFNILTTSECINGTMDFILESSCCIDQYGQPCDAAQATRDTLQYLISIKDAAGNISNQIKTPEIYLICR